MNNKQQAIINTKDAMDIIINEAKKAIAEKFETNIEMVETAISMKNENVLSMMRQLVEKGVNEVADSL